MPAVPGFSERSINDVAYLVDGQLTVEADSVLMAAGEVSAITPTHRHPPGTVLGYDAGTAKWYLATDSLVDVGTQASITSSGHADTIGDIVIVGPHGTITVTTSTGTGTEAECATDLNADEQFNALYVASSGGGELTITSLATGEDVWFYLDSTTNDGFGFAEGQANEVNGTDGEFVVTTGFAELLDDEGSAVDYQVGALWRGHFRAAALSSLSARAKRVLLKRGSKFLG